MDAAAKLTAKRHTFRRISMKRIPMVALLGPAIIGVVTTLGCESKPTDKPVATDTTAPAENDPMAALTETERAAVLAQKVCPVTNEPLGSMGTPLKVTVEGRDVWLCCEGCADAVKEDPAKYFAILDAPPASEGEAAAKDEAAPAGEATAQPPAS
jgi:hypothetical protein